MHSRIFQVSMEPINEEEYICEGDYYEHWFTREIADYVSDDCNREKDIEWLTEIANGYIVSKDDYGEYLIVTDKKEYFSENYKQFIKALDEIGTPTLEEFVNGIDLWDLRTAHEDRFGFYIDADGELMTFNKFIRKCVVNAKYYIGGIVDYHY